MSDEESTSAAAPATTSAAADSPQKIQTAIEALSAIVPSLSSAAASNPLSVLNHPDTYSQISTLLRHPNSGAGDNNLCRWLYDTFQTGIPQLQLVVLRFLPVIAGVYLSRVGDRKPQAGFEAVLLALYSHETTSRAGQAVSVTIPDLTHPSVYHESKAPIKNSATELNMAVVSPALEPHGTVRSTRRGRIVGVALELFYSKISHMPISSKIDFCEFCKMWAGQDGDMYMHFEEEEEEEKERVVEEQNSEVKREGRVPLGWELLQPVMMILGHCLLGPNKKEEGVFDVASDACRCLFARVMHDVDPKAILPMRSLLRLSKRALTNDDDDPTELPFSDVISI
ncbi:hyccin [Abrus precatorius]|uniref:Hyccin n=1 Tax=Abrus precatorius TaxID=3816 RepID=A0A8B8JQR0_ABRPR|nr:hyccin [Abrus precatorius]